MARPILRATWVRQWLLDNEAQTQARLMDDQGRFFAGIETGPLWTENLGEVPAVHLTRGDGQPLTVGAYLHWIAIHQVSSEHRLAGQFYLNEYKGFRDLGESAWWQRGDPDDAELRPDRAAIRLQLRWG
jgi:hypothetical protein